MSQCGCKSFGNSLWFHSKGKYLFHSASYPSFPHYHSITVGGSFQLAIKKRRKYFTVSVNFCLLQKEKTILFTFAIPEMITNTQICLEQKEL